MCNGLLFSHLQLMLGVVNALQEKILIVFETDSVVSTTTAFVIMKKLNPLDLCTNSVCVPLLGVDHNDPSVKDLLALMQNQPEALATLSSISQGDLHRAITFLQGAARLFRFSISSKELINVLRVIPHEVVQALLAACKSGLFDSANKEVNNVIAEGYLVSQMLSQLFDMVVESEDMTDEQKARIFKKLGEPDKGYVIYCPGLFVMVMDSRRDECC
uniref:Replication factor C subunit 2 n=1 Tax=Tanacetum cinerariifolium TaxID=118510 RepID=A0A699I9C0_TANCI|nr:replication factor C subunit 2 [Tanacetum cinerariifolium]